MHEATSVRNDTCGFSALLALFQRTVANLSAGSTSGATGASVSRTRSGRVTLTMVFPKLVLRIVGCLNSLGGGKGISSVLGGSIIKKDEMSGYSDTKISLKQTGKHTQIQQPCVMSPFCW